MSKEANWRRRNAAVNGMPYGTENTAVMAEQAGTGFGPRGATGAASEWDFLPEDLRDLRDGADTPQQFWARMRKLAEFERQRSAITGANPENLLTEEDWQSFWLRAGKPEKADGYTLPQKWASGDVDAEVASEVSQVLEKDRQAFMHACHACNLTGKQAEALFGIVGGLMAENIVREREGVVPTEQVLAELWPKDTERHLDAARRGARHAGLADELDACGLSCNPHVLRLARALGEAVGESSAPGSGGYGTHLPSGDSAREEMYRLIASDAYRKNEADAIRKVEALSRRVDLR